MIRYSFLLMMLFVTACASYPSAPLHQPTKDAAYHLQGNDVIRLHVYEEPELSGKFKLDSQGQIALPLTGKIDLKNRTETEAARVIETTLQQQGFLKHPKVALEIATARPYYILGEIGQSGRYEFQSGLTVYQAVATAGGYSYRADRHDIVITRKISGHTSKLQAVEQTPVYPGDVIEIGERYF